ncbi:hypothetical protein BDV10DRAFT_187420 [Aspergillus recurvatus]
MIPCCGFDCVPSDISTWLAVSCIRRQFSLPTARVDTCIHSLQGSVSGGTLSSFTQAFDTYSFRQLYRIHAPFAPAPIRPERTFPEQRSSTWVLQTFGLHLSSAPDTPAILHPLGDDRLGRITFTPDSYMSCTITSRDAASPMSSPSWIVASGEENYCGPFKLYHEDG